MIYVLVCLIIVVAMCLLESQREKDKLSVERYSFVSSKIDRDCKIVFLSDLHNKEFSKNNKRLVEEIKKLEPDLICIGGDMIVTKRSKTDFNVLNNLLDEIFDLCPIVYANGNHELRLYRDDCKEKYGKYKDEFEDALSINNVIYLNDKYYDFGNLRIYGLELDKNCYRHFWSSKMSDDYVERHLNSIDPNKYNILLAHSPLFFDKYAKWGADLTLAGHFHGGVLRIDKQGVLTSQWQLFHKWCCGLFNIGNSSMIVSRGLGGHTINVRLNNLPEISYIELKTEDNK